jgi:hypothetical protein
MLPEQDVKRHFACRQGRGPLALPRVRAGDGGNWSYQSISLASHGAHAGLEGCPGHPPQATNDMSALHWVKGIRREKRYRNHLVSPAR